MDKGKDAAAKAFTKGKTKNPWAFFAAFSAAGEPLGLTDVYADKDVTFDFLVALLRENPDFDKFTKEEEATFAAAKAAPKNAKAQLAAGVVLEELGRYVDSTAYLHRAIQADRSSQESAAAYRALLRMARYSRQWETLQKICTEVEALPKEVRAKLNLEADVVMETAFHKLALKDYEAARKMLHEAIRTHPNSMRQSEFHFYAGVASFFLKDKDRAYYHWCHVVETMPDDRLARRCYIAAAHEGMPYENPELGGYQANLKGGNIQVIQRAYDRASAVYARLKVDEATK